MRLSEVILLKMDCLSDFLLLILEGYKFTFVITNLTFNIWNTISQKP